MSPNLRSMIFTQRPLSSALVAVFLVALGAGCENRAIGRACDPQADAGTNQAVYNGSALECPTRLCMKPSKDPGAKPTDTAAYCSAECNNDSDCETEEKRIPTNPRDRRCTSNKFMCGIAFEVGPLCCKKVCLCSDFVTPASIAAAQSNCEKARGVSTCVNL